MKAAGLIAISSWATGQTAPTPLTLPVSQDFGTASFTTLPSGFAAWNGLSGAAVSTLALAQSSVPTGNATLTAATAAQTTGAAYGYAASSDAKFYVQTSSNTTNGVNQLVMALNSTGRQDLVVGYTVDVISAQPRTIGVVCQYRVGSSGTWTTVTATSGTNPYSQAGGTTGLKTTVSATLPAAANNVAVVQVRWAFWRGTETGNSAGIGIDNVTVTSNPLGGVDTIPPTLASVSPSDNATSIAIGTSLSATFSENIAAGTGNITLYKASDNSVVQNFAVGTSAVTISGATATFTPTAQLLNFTDYYVLIPSGVIVDTAANSFAGITATTAWNFKTIPADITPPTISSVTPVTASTNIAPPTSLTVTFSENVQIASTGSPKIYVKKVSDDSTVATIDSTAFGPVSVTGAVATIPLPAPLDFGVSYYVTIDTGAFEDVSTSNNQFAGLPKFVPSTTTLSWGFTTIDVPGLTTTYTQNFSAFTSSATLPQGWSSSGAAGYLTTYQGDWGTSTPNPVTPIITLGGFKGNSSVFGYHHTSATVTTSTGTPLGQILTLRNTTGAVLDNLVVAYKGRTAIPANTRLPAYAVTVNGTSVAALSDSTSDPDNTQRNVSLTGLNIADGATFQIVWSSSYPSVGAGSARQIGISDVAVTVGTASFPPSISGPLVPVLTTGATAVDVQANVIGDGGATITDRGFVYSLTNNAPTIGGANVIQWTDPSPTTGALNATLTGLSVSSTYTIRAYAINANGTTYTGAVTFTTIGLPPTLSASYAQAFNAYLGTNPAGWSAISSNAIQSYGSDWNTTTSNGGFSGNVSNPGVLGYRHTGSTGTLTVTLRLINGSGNTLSSLYVKFLGRVFDTANPITVGRSPIWTVAVNGAAAPSLQYSTVGNADLTVSDVITGLSIAPGAEFSITWTSDRGAGSGSSKKIGIADVLVAIPTAPVLSTASASSITPTTATLNGQVTADGYLALTARGFVYAPTATNSNPLIGGTGVTNVVEGGTTVSAFTSPLTGLSPATGYSLKAYATNSLGTTYSTVATFTTSGSVPVLASASASSVTSTTATLNGQITSNGLLTITARGFVYSATTTNSNPLIGGTGVTNVVEGGTTVSAFNSALTGLTVSTGYSLKAYATNSLGTAYSTVATFTTSSPSTGYDTWKNSPVGSGGQSYDLDSDGDGIDNGVEYFMGTAGNAFTPNPGIVAGVVTWPRAAGTTITSFKVEVSTNLTSWQDATVSYNSNLAINSTQVAFTLPTTPGPFFVRLNVTP